jgi:hypothetical protein
MVKDMLKEYEKTLEAIVDERVCCNTKNDVPKSIKLKKFEKKRDSFYKIIENKVSRETMMELDCLFGELMEVYTEHYFKIGFSYGVMIVKGASDNDKRF